MKTNKERYREDFVKHGSSYRALGWKSEDSSRKRFEIFSRDIDFSGRSVLDVGCGFGDFYAYLVESDNDFDYLGVDVVEEFVDEAQERYSDARFAVRDYFENPLDRTFDVIVASGSLNSNSSQPYEDRERAIKIMFENSGEALVFNMAGGYPEPKNKSTNRVYYADSIRMLEYCALMADEIVFWQGYRNKEFSICMFKRPR